jgi:hypothetical protein
MGTSQKQKLKLLAPELALDNLTIKSTVDLALDNLLELQESFLQNELSRYNYFKDCKPEKAPTQEILCIHLQDSISGLINLITKIQKYILELNSLERAEKMAKQTWGGLPDRYYILLYYDVKNPSARDKFHAVIERY